MEDQKICLSPTYKHIKIRAINSPKELKEKMRKDYKTKVQNCRDVLFNRFRNSVAENDIHTTLSEIYNGMFNITDKEEAETLEEIKKELIQEEFDWWLQEYEKTQLDNIDWSLFNQDETIICPICQKNNLALKDSNLSCTLCKYSLKTTKTLAEIRSAIFDTIEKHNICNMDVEFTVVPEIDQTHIYLICRVCNDMYLVF